jgi:tetratricopeptide (TPR) repeat protein
MPSGEPPLAMTDRPIVEERRGKNDPIKTETLIAVATVRIQAAVDPNRSTQEREELANHARLAYQKVLTREPKNLEALRGMARMYAVLQDKGKCLEWYRRAEQAHPKNADLMFEMGKTLGSHFKDKDAMIACLQAAAKLAPENRTYRNELGFTLALAGRYDEAYEWLIRTMSEAKARYNLAGIAEHNGQSQQAKMQLALALKADPSHEPSKEMLAAIGAQRDTPMETPIRSVSHEHLAPAQLGPSPTIPIDPLTPRKAPPTTPKGPETLSQDFNRQKAAPPPLISSGLDR